MGLIFKPSQSQCVFGLNDFCSLFHVRTAAPPGLRSRQHVSVTDKSFCLRVESRAGSPGRSAGGVNCCLTGVAAGVFTAYLMRMQALPSQTFGEESSCAGIKSRTLCPRL